MSQPQQSWDPLLYRHAAAFVPDLGAPLVDLLAPHPGERILDLGCGTGELTQTLHARGADVLGVDASEDMVTAARTKHPEVSFRVADGECLSFSGDFDAVFSNAALHWMPRAHDVAQGIFRALRPGGRFVAELGGVDNVATVRRAAAEVLSSGGFRAVALPAWYFPSVGEYSAVLEAAGFRVRLAQWFERPTRLAGEGGLRTWLSLFCEPLLQRLGEAAPAFISDVEARCRGALFRDGDWWIDYARLRIFATRA